MISISSLKRQASGARIKSFDPHSEGF